MSEILNATQHIRTLLSTVIGETKVKTFFSYYAIFKDDTMFALYKQGKFYLRISPNYSQYHYWTHQLERLNDKHSGIYDKHFYYIPDHQLDKIADYGDVISQTIAELRQTKMQQAQSRKKLLRSLPNLNINIERLLKRLGILSIEDFFAMGEMAIFVELIKRGIEVDQNLLFKLYGARHHQYVYMLSDKQKLAILTEANQALYDAGLRRRFKIPQALL